MQILNLQKQIFPHTQIRTSIHYDLGTRVCAFEDIKSAFTDLYQYKNQSIYSLKHRGSRINLQLQILNLQNQSLYSL